MSKKSPPSYSLPPPYSSLLPFRSSALSFLFVSSPSPLLISASNSVQYLPLSLSPHSSLSITPSLVSLSFSVRSPLSLFPSRLSKAALSGVGSLLAYRVSFGQFSLVSCTRASFTEDSVPFFPHVDVN